MIPKIVKYNFINIYSFLVQDLIAIFINSHENVSKTFMQLLTNFNSPIKYNSHSDNNFYLVRYETKTDRENTAFFIKFHYSLKLWKLKSF